MLLGRIFVKIKVVKGWMADDFFKANVQDTGLLNLPVETVASGPASESIPVIASGTSGFLAPLIEAANQKAHKIGDWYRTPPPKETKK